MKKVYQKKDAHSNMSSMRVTVSGKSKTIVFENKKKNGSLQFETTDVNVQKAIESTNYFSEGKIVLTEGVAFTEMEKVEKQVLQQKAAAEEDIVVNDTASLPTPEAGKPEPAESTSKEYGAVTNFQQAKDVLFAEFGVSKNALTKPELIVKKAAELGVQFPNLKPVAEA